MASASAGATVSTPAPATTAPSTPTRPPDPLVNPVIAGRFAMADGRKLAIKCWGEGSPTVILEGGHPSDGLAQFEGTEFARTVASHTRTCAYARAGYGGSDPAPDEPRDADDVIRDLEELLEAAKVGGPLVLVGSSFGGMIVTY